MKVSAIAKTLVMKANTSMKMGHVYQAAIIKSQLILIQYHIVLILVIPINTFMKMELAPNSAQTLTSKKLPLTACNYVVLLALLMNSIDKNLKNVFLIVASLW